MEHNEERCAECILCNTPGLQEYCCKDCKKLKIYKKEKIKYFFSRFTFLHKKGQK